MTAANAIEPVTGVLLERAREPAGLRKMLGLSLVAHAIGIAVFALTSAGLPSAREESLRSVMTISLGGAPGPRSGGMTPLGGRPVQAPAPAPDVAPRRPEPVRPPAPRQPEMTLPRQNERVVRRPQPRNAPAEARGTTPTRGAEPQPGSSVAETGARGVGFGLSTGGGGAGGYLDVGDFCCPEYLTTMIQLIQRNWNSKQQVAANNMVKFTIQRDGSLTGVELEASSGYAALDLASQRAILLTRQLPPLPNAFPNRDLTVHLRFQYQP